MSGLSVHLTAPNGRRYIQPTGLFINNEFIQSRSGNKITSINPTDESEIAYVYAAGDHEVNLAVVAARKALLDPSWKEISPTKRGQMIWKLADLVEQHKETLATIETWDNGKPYSAALNGDLAEAILALRYYAGWADKHFGQTISTTSEKFTYTLRQPIGVVAQIIPWNYPIVMASWKLGPALACGNTIVLKAAEQTPLSILYLATLIREAGFPPGVVNLLNGYGSEAGAALVQHPGIDKVAFTGSTVTGRQIMKLAASTLKHISLETGGKSPLLVFPDADLQQAAKWAHRGIMSNQGQICSATSRILVHESVYVRFMELFKETIKNTGLVGDPFRPETYQGPQVTKAQFDRVLTYIESGKQAGATLIAGGEPYKNAEGKGFFIAPTVFGDVTEDMEIYREEIFGPFAVVASFSTEAQGLSMANNTIYGLGASIFTNDITRAHRLASNIQSGMVWINSSNDSDPRIPFGGVKQSGIGRELGEAGLEAYTQIKAVHVNVGRNI